MSHQTFNEFIPRGDVVTVEPPIDQRATKRDREPDAKALDQPAIRVAVPQ